MFSASQNFLFRTTSIFNNLFVVFDYRLAYPRLCPLIPFVLYIGRVHNVEKWERLKEPEEPGELEKPVGHWRQNSRGRLIVSRATGLPVSNNVYL